MVRVEGNRLQAEPAGNRLPLRFSGDSARALKACTRAEREAKGTGALVLGRTLHIARWGLIDGADFPR